MDKMPIDVIFKNQRDYFYSGATKGVGSRLANLKKLKRALEDYEERMYEAIQKDLRKSQFETFTTELSVIYSELNHALQNTPKWMDRKRVPNTKLSFPSRSYIYKEPYGVVLIISPWNYPYLLTLSPLIGALAAGNTAVVKPSELAPATSQVMEDMISEYFEPEVVTLIQGGVETNKKLMEKDFDYIFFTGSTQVGKIVMEAAAKNLTPVTLELGGKSPAIIDASADIKVTAKRIAWAKFTNAGQTCVAPDFLYVHKSIKSEFLAELKSVISEMFGEDPYESDDYPRVITERHFNRLTSLIETEKVIHGGDHRSSDKYIAPTIMDNVDWNDEVMQEEIFGPILPVMEYENLDEIIQLLQRKPKPLAFYIFTNTKKNEKKVLQEMSFGGGAVNDAVIHLGNHNLPFGGVGSSGMGAYHGKHSFDTFTHEKSVFKRGFRFDIPFRYAPFKDRFSWVRKVLG